MKMVSFISRILPLQIAHAHCDIPCGIYEPKAAQTAALTVQVMVQKIVNPPKVDEKDVNSIRNFHNTMTRYVMNKEVHAQICKEELLILWTDYFKEEHLEKFPDLHNTFWKAAKLCSQNKQHVDEKMAQELVDATNKIADIFNKSKASK